MKFCAINIRGKPRLSHVQSAPEANQTKPKKRKREKIEKISKIKIKIKKIKIGAEKEKRVCLQ